MTYFAVGEEKAHTFDADLQESSFTRSQILDGKLSAELHAGHSSSPSSSRSFHGFFDAVVQGLALKRGSKGCYH